MLPLLQNRSPAGGLAAPAPARRREAVSAACAAAAATACSRQRLQRRLRLAAAAPTHSAAAAAAAAAATAAIAATGSLLSGGRGCGASSKKLLLPLRKARRAATAAAAVPPSSTGKGDARVATSGPIAAASPAAAGAAAPATAAAAAAAGAEKAGSPNGGGSSNGAGPATAVATAAAQPAVTDVDNGSGGGNGGGGGGGGAPWYAVVALSAMAALICSVDRAAISVAILPMADEYGWSDSTKGAVNAAFYAGYTVTNLVGGYLAATVGSKRTLGAGVAVWSAFTVLTPWAAATRAMPLLLSVRCAMGCGEGTAYPCIQAVVKGWVPRDARSRALTLIYSGGQLGTIIALLTAPAIISAAGWEAVFWAYGGLGALWLLAWQPLVAEVPPLYSHSGAAASAAPASPTVAAALGSAEKETAAAAAAAAADAPTAAARQVFNGSSTSSSTSHTRGKPEMLITSSSDDEASSQRSVPGLLELPWKQFFTNRAFLGIMAAHSAFGAGHYVMLSWLPTFYNQAFGVGVREAATLSVLPWLATVAVSSSSGVLADYLTNSGRLDVTRTRKLLQVTGAVLPAVCLLALADAHDAERLGLGAALALLTGGVALGGFQSAGFAANHQDIASARWAPLLFGVTNALSSLVGSASVYATGGLLDAGYGWGAVFTGVAVTYVAGAVGYAALGSGERQFE